MRNVKVLSLIAALASVGAAAACGSRSAPLAATAGPQPVFARAVAARAEIGRAELWAAHCSRCHNIRPASEYSRAQWPVIVNHMRTIGDLPGRDYWQLMEYLTGRPAGKSVAARGAGGTR